MQKLEKIRAKQLLSAKERKRKERKMKASKGIKNGPRPGPASRRKAAERSGSDDSDLDDRPTKVIKETLVAMDVTEDAKSVGEDSTPGNGTMTISEAMSEYAASCSDATRAADAIDGRSKLKEMKLIRERFADVKNSADPRAISGKSMENIKEVYNTTRDMEMEANRQTEIGRRPRKTGLLAGTSDVIKKMNQVTSELREMIVTNDISAERCKAILKVGSLYEDIIIKLLSDRSKLEGKIEALCQVGGGSYGTGNATNDGRETSGPTKTKSIYKKLKAASLKQGGMMKENKAVKEDDKANKTQALGSTEAASIRGPPPAIRQGTTTMGTWSLVVKKGSADSRALKDVVREMGSALEDVRIKEVKELKDGRILIRTPSEKDKKKIMGSSGLKAADLTIDNRERLGNKIVLLEVERDIGNDELISNMYDKNFKEKITKEKYKESIRVINRRTDGDRDSGNVTVECTKDIADVLLFQGRAYVGCSSYRVRQRIDVRHCGKCLKYGHHEVDCRAKEKVCYKCGNMGHRRNECTLEERCKSCAEMRRACGHASLSMGCPLYREKVRSLRNKY